MKEKKAIASLNNIFLIQKIMSGVKVLFVHSADVFLNKMRNIPKLRVPHCTENYKTNIPRNETARPRSQFLQSCICERYILYSEILTIGLPFFVYCCCGPIVGIYKSLTETWMWKLGTRPYSFISGNICFEFSVHCICSAGTKGPWINLVI